MECEIVTLVVSPRHAYEGRPSSGGPPNNEGVAVGGGLAPFDGIETADSVRVRAHKGIFGDRYFGTKFTYASMTLIAEESLRWLEGELAAGPFDPSLARRNIVTRGLDVDTLARTSFTLDAGHGPIRFRSLTPANPCAWMNEVFAPGAHQALRGRGGIRCEPLDDGELSVGPASISNITPLPPEELTRRVKAATT